MIMNETNVESVSLLSDQATAICIWIVNAIFCQVIDIFGMCTNVINMICFIKQGFQDSVNVSLFGLAIADFCSLITLFGTNIFLTPAFSSADLPFVSAEVMYLTVGLLHVTFSRISEWITALVTLERCLCITAPLKVKNVVTPRRVSVIISSVFIILISSVAPIYMVNRLDRKFVPDRNRTLLGIVYTEHRGSMEYIFYIINNVLVPFLAFFIIIICTVTLVVKLRNASKWRANSSASSQGDTVTKRNQKAARMVMMISILFIVCFIPLCLVYIAMSLTPELSVVGKHKNILFAVSGVSVILESINSSSNIIIYYYMSSNYKTAFHQLFFKGGQRKLSRVTSDGMHSH